VNDCNPEIPPSWKLHCGECPVSRSRVLWREADASWEETSMYTGREQRGRGPDAFTQNTGNNVGKGHLPAGLGDNLQGRCGIGQPKPLRGLWSGAWAHMSEKEGVTPFEVDGATTASGNTRSRAKEPWDLAATVWTRTRKGSASAPWRVCRQSCSWRGVCEPTLEPPACDAGRWRKAKPPNRTRENRPSGMTTGARGNVTGGRTANPPRSSIAEDSIWPAPPVRASRIPATHMKLRQFVVE
jgi:hypothetical protein